MASCMDGALREPRAELSLPPSDDFDWTPLWRVLVYDLLTTSDARKVIDLAEEHAAQHGYACSRHKHFPTTDIAIEPSSAPALDSAVRPLVQRVVLPTMALAYGFDLEDLSVRDLFFVKYEAAGSSQNRLAPHRDGNLLSFSILLSDPATDFEGGGLCFHSLGPSCEACGGAGEQSDRRSACQRCSGRGHLAVPGVRQGDLTLHCGKLLHESLPITRGTRYIVVGFVSVHAPHVDVAFVEEDPLANSSSVGAWADYEILAESMAVDAASSSPTAPSSCTPTATHSDVLQRSGLCVRWVSAAVGVGLFTTRSFEAGEILLSEPPLVAMLEFDDGASSRRSRHCAECLKHLTHTTARGSEHEQVQVCRFGCSSAWCSERCRQRAEASGHALLCPSRSEAMRAFLDESEQAFNEYFVLAARLFASPPSSRLASHLRANEARSPTSATDGGASADDSTSTAQTSCICVGLKGVPWWLTVDPPDDLEQARLHCEGAQALTEVQCERLHSVLCHVLSQQSGREDVEVDSSDGVHDAERTMLTPRSLALAMGALRMNVIGVCVESEAGTLAGMALYDVVSRANHSCVPNAHLESFADDTKGAHASLRAARRIASSEEVVIDYLGLLSNGAEKRAALREQYKFDCVCQSCVCQSSIS